MTVLPCLLPPILVMMLAMLPTAACALDVGVGVAVAEKQLFTANDLLWVEVRAGDQQLAETMDAYSSRAGFFVPLGQFARVLDLAITVLPPDQRAEGWILSRNRGLTVDLRTQTATVGGRTIPFNESQARLYKDDIYLRLDLVEALLPVRLQANPSAQLLTVTPTEPLPFSQKAARAQLRTGLSESPPTAGQIVPVETPYALLSAPVFDVDIGGQATRDGSDQTRQYSIRAAGDLAYGGFRGFVGSDGKGKINDVRLSLQRKSPDGHALGALGGVRVAAGDVFTPSSALGAGSNGGRGVSYSSAPLETVDLSTPLNLRGELQIGEEVELYVNETLRASQATPDQGRYEFLNVPLALGMNVVRLVFYGSQGQKREQVRRINLGAGQVEAGKFVVRFGAVQQELAVVQIGKPPSGSESGAVRAVAIVDYGIGSRLTASGGVARYTPRGGTARFLGLGGLRGSLAGMALQGDFALDDRGGSGATLGVAARPLGISILAHDSEYAGGFVDETRQAGVIDDVVLRRASDIRADTSIHAAKNFTIPVSLDLRRLERSDGSVSLSSSARTSAPVRSFYVSTVLSYNSDTVGAVGNNRLLAGVDVSTLVAKRFQLRGGISYQIKPDQQIDSAYFLADIQLSEVNGLRLGVTRSAGPQGETGLQASHNYRAKRFNIATNTSYDMHSRQWRVGLQLGFSLAPDPVTRHYVLARPGAATGGAVAVDAFVDENGDGVRQAGEAPVRGIVVDTPAGSITTDRYGHAGIGDLGDGGKAVLQVDSGNAEDPFLAGAPAAFQIVPRPGRVTRIKIPLRQSAEVALTAVLQRGDDNNRPLSALNVELVARIGGMIVGARTDHAGVAIFEAVPPGNYDVRLQPAQADGLGLMLVKAVGLVVPAGGGFVRVGEILVDVRPATKQ